MIKRITVALMLAASVFAVLPAAPAAAGTHNCVTEREYRAVHRGMLKRRVHRIFDTNGHLEARWRYGPVRQYRICGVPNGEVQVTYKRRYDTSGPPYRVFTKYAYTV